MLPQVSVVVISGSVLLTLKAAVDGTRFSSHVQHHTGDRTGFDPDGRPRDSVIRSSCETDPEHQFWNVSQLHWARIQAGRMERKQTLYDFPMSAGDRQTIEASKRALRQQEDTAEGAAEGDTAAHT